MRKTDRTKTRKHIVPWMAGALGLISITAGACDHGWIWEGADKGGPDSSTGGTIGSSETGGTFGGNDAGYGYGDGGPGTGGTIEPYPDGGFGTGEAWALCRAPVVRPTWVARAARPGSVASASRSTTTCLCEDIVAAKDQASADCQQSGLYLITFGPAGDCHVGVGDERRLSYTCCPNPDSTPTSDPASCQARVSGDGRTCQSDSALDGLADGLPGAERRRPGPGAIRKLWRRWPRVPLVRVLHHGWLGPSAATVQPCNTLNAVVVFANAEGRHARVLPRFPFRRADRLPAFRDEDQLPRRHCGAGAPADPGLAGPLAAAGAGGYGGGAAAKVPGALEPRHAANRLAAHEAGQAIGTASLRASDLPGREELSPWLGGVYVAPAFRGRGIASALCRTVEERAAALGHDRLYLFTLDQQALYQRLGWRAIERTSWRGRAIDLMVKALDGTNTGQSR